MRSFFRRLISRPSPACLSYVCSSVGSDANCPVDMAPCSHLFGFSCRHLTDGPLPCDSCIFRLGGCSDATSR